jgi:hypothetical protein
MVINEMEVMFSEEVVQYPERVIEREGKHGRYFYAMIKDSATNQLEMRDKELLFHFEVFGAYFCNSSKRVAWITGAMVCYLEDQGNADDITNTVTGYILLFIFRTR